MALVAPTLTGTVTTAQNTSSSNSITIPRPGGIAAGNLLVACLRGAGTTGSDWQSPGFSRQGRIFAPGGADRISGFYIKPVEDVNEEPTEYTFSKDISDTRAIGVMFALRGVDLTNPIAGFATGAALEEGVIKSIPFTTDLPAILVGVTMNELTSPNPPGVTRDPELLNEIVYHASSTLTTVTRTSLWLGQAEITEPNVPELSYTWAANSGVYAMAIAFRGAEEDLSPPLGTPGPIEVETTNPTGAGVSDGQAVVSWPPVENADRYVVDLNGSVVNSNVRDTTITIRNLGAGDYTVGVVAHPGD